MEEICCCSICFMPYDQVVPRLLSCAHTFCENCLKDLLVIKDNKGELVCPNCRNTEYIPSKSVLDLKKNFSLEEVAIQFSGSVIKKQEEEKSKERNQLLVDQKEKIQQISKKLKEKTEVCASSISENTQQVTKKQQEVTKIVERAFDTIEEQLLDKLHQRRKELLKKAKKNPVALDNQKNHLEDKINEATQLISDSENDKVILEKGDKIIHEMQELLECNWDLLSKTTINFDFKLDNKKVNDMLDDLENIGIMNIKQIVSSQENQKQPVLKIENDFDKMKLQADNLQRIIQERDEAERLLEAKRQQELKKIQLEQQRAKEQNQRELNMREQRMREQNQREQNQREQYMRQREQRNQQNQREQIQRNEQNQREQIQRNEQNQREQIQRNERIQREQIQRNEQIQREQIQRNEQLQRNAQIEREQNQRNQQLKARRDQQATRYQLEQQRIEQCRIVQEKAQQALHQKRAQQALEQEERRKKLAQERNPFSPKRSSQPLNAQQMNFSPNRALNSNPKPKPISVPFSNDAQWDQWRQRKN